MNEINKSRRTIHIESMAQMNTVEMQNTAGYLCMRARTACAPSEGFIPHEVVARGDEMVVPEGQRRVVVMDLMVS
jgi:hypothetical protein